MWTLAEQVLQSRFLLGTAQYPTLAIMLDAIQAAETDVITVSLKRQLHHKSSKNSFWDSIVALGKHLLPNTAGCRTAREAIEVAEMARELFQTHWLKLEVIGDEYTLQPNPFELVKAAHLLVKRGFEVFPYCTEDLIVCQRLMDCGCRILMPWAAPIGSGKGLLHRYHLMQLRERYSSIILIIDAGIGKPSQATEAMELGFDGILLNSAVSLAENPVLMAKAFRNAILAGREAYEAGMILEQNSARPSTPLIDTPFWHQTL
jgi:thiazole synthase